LRHEENVDWVKATIYEKLNLVQTGLVSLKDQINDFANFSYRNAEQVLSLLKPFLEITGTVVVLSDEIVGVNGKNYIKAIATFTDGTSDEEGKLNAIQSVGWAREAESRSGMDVSQLTGSTSSYARKYALGGLFALDDNKDADSMDNRDQTHHNGAEVKGDGFCTIKQSLSMERMSRNKYTMPGDVAMLKSIAKDGYVITEAQAQIHINDFIEGQKLNKPVKKSVKVELLDQLETLNDGNHAEKFHQMLEYLTNNNFSQGSVNEILEGIKKIKEGK